MLNLDSIPIKNDSLDEVEIYGITIDTNSYDELKKYLQQLCQAYETKNSTPLKNCSIEEIKEESTVSYTDEYEKIFGVNGDHKVVLCLCFILIMVTGLSGNILVILTVSCNKSMWSSMHMFIFSLAMSDILLSATCIPINIIQVTSTEWTSGPITCKMMPFFMELSGCASMLILCCMAINRYLAIVHPLKFANFKSVSNTEHSRQNLQPFKDDYLCFFPNKDDVTLTARYSFTPELSETIQTSIILSVIIWLVAALTSAPYAYYFDIYNSKICGLENDTGECQKIAGYVSCYARAGTILEKYNLKRMSFSILFVLPALIMIFSYGIIVYTLWVKAPVGVVVMSVAAVRTHYKRRAIKMLILVFCLFIVCWSPLHIFYLIAREESLLVTSELNSIRFYAQCLALSSTAWNPIVYAFMNQKFRTSFKNILLRHRNQVSPLFIDKLPVLQDGKNGGNHTSDKNGVVIRNGITKETGTSKV